MENSQENKILSMYKNFTIIVERLFQSRDLAHIAHLKTESYSEHVALNDYYDELIVLIDDLVETYQGENQVVLDITIPESRFKDPKLHLKELLDIINNFSFSRGVENVIDDIATLISQTLYKLTFLK